MLLSLVKDWLKESSLANPLRVVIDSNLWVSLLIFSDQRFSRIFSALQANYLKPLASDLTFAEWRAVASSGRFPKKSFDAEQSIEKFKQIVCWHHVLSEHCLGLPQCKDATDQKFVELAYCASARVVVTDDRKLLDCFKKQPFLKKCIALPSLDFEAVLEEIYPYLSVKDDNNNQTIPPS